ncbi:MAG: ATP-grasp domain-containing protein [Flammeovirgaceae bacterium]
MNWRNRYTRLIKFEFWPTWFFYAPFIFQWLFYSLKSRSLSYFMQANPGMRFGGLFQYSKFAILRQVSPAYRPKSVFFEELPADPNFYQTDFEYPFICKPDIGERGKAVTLIRNEQDWQDLLPQMHQPFILQEYVDFNTELGVLYYRFPNGGSGISSIVSKGFLTMVGDGRHTLNELVAQHVRAANRSEFFAKKFAQVWDEVLPKGQALVLEEIGNHCRGTTFYNANHLINEQLVQVFDEIAQPLQGFYYGRFDLRVKSLEDLYNGKNIRVVEVNGVNSEAAHIYDPHYSLFTAYRDVAHNLRIVYKIAKQLKGKSKAISYRALASAAKKHFLSRA